MFKKYLIVFYFLFLLPTGVISTNNHVVNGNFSNGLNGWNYSAGFEVCTEPTAECALFRDNVGEKYVYIKQTFTPNDLVNLTVNISKVSGSYPWGFRIYNSTNIILYQYNIPNGHFEMSLLDKHPPNNSNITIEFFTHVFGFYGNTAVFLIQNVTNYYSVEEGYIDTHCDITVESYPSEVTLNVLICTENNGTHYKKWVESSINHTETSLNTISGLTPNSMMTIYKNNKFWKTFMSNATGYIIFSYNEGFSEIQFELGEYIASIDSTMSVIWDLVNNLVDNVGSIISIIIIGFVISIIYVIKTFIHKAINK